MSALVQLAPPHLPELLRVLQADPVSNVFLLHLARRTGLQEKHGTVFYGHRNNSGSLLGVGAFGSTLLAWMPDASSLPLFSAEALRRRGQWKSLLGDARSIDPLWSTLEPKVGPPVENHTEDWLALSRPHFTPAQTCIKVQIATESDLTRILPLRFAMQAEPEGRISTPEDRGRIRRRCAESIRDRHLFYVEEAGEVVFTAAFSASSPEATQISSVFTRPEYRGQGVATAALTALCAHALSLSERVSLFVLPSNTPAQRVYAKLGFCRVATARSIRVVG